MQERYKSYKSACLAMAKVLGYELRGKGHGRRPFAGAYENDKCIEYNYRGYAGLSTWLAKKYTEKTGLPAPVVYYD